MDKEEETTKIEQTPPAPQGAEDYIKAIAELRANSVPKAEFEKLKAEKSLLVKTLATGGSLPADGQPKARTIEEVRKAFLSSELSNIEKAKAALELRALLIDSKSPDPFLPNGKKMAIDQSDRDAAQRVADVLKGCIEAAEGDEQSFTDRLQRQMNDTGPVRPRKK